MPKNEPEMTRLDELRLQRELKEMLLDNVRAIYGPQNPKNHGFDIIISRMKGSDSKEVVMARAIVYTEPNFVQWRLLKDASRFTYGIVVALQEFSKDLEREMGLITANLRQGDTYGYKGEMLVLDI